MNKLPSVTEIIGVYNDFSAVPPDVLEFAAERGKVIHALCAGYARGLFTVVPDELTGYFRSFQSWFDAYVKEVLVVEEEVIHPTLGYCGHPDIIARLKGISPGNEDTIALIDYKTPRVHNKLWDAQVVAYAEAIKHQYAIARCGTLRLQKDGSLPVMHWIDNYAQAFNCFMSMLNIWHYLNTDS